MRIRRTLLWLLFSWLLVMAFQGCGGCADSPTHFGSLGSAQMDSSPTGNGQPYDGKPGPGQYYRFVPGHVCTPENDVFAELDVTETTIMATHYNPSNCSIVHETVLFEQVDSSVMNPSHLGWNDGIYEKRGERPSGSSRNLPVTEAWCRSRESKDAAFDIIVQETASTGKMLATVYGAHLLKERVEIDPVETFVVGRNLQKSELLYSSPNLEIKIDLGSLTGEGLGRFVGRLRARLATGGDVALNLSCRTGALLDGQQTFRPTFSFDVSSGLLPANAIFGRASIGTYFDANGILKIAPVGIPRFDFQSSSKEFLGLHLEGGAINIVPESVHFESAFWSVMYGASVSSNVAVAPDGSNSAALLRDTSINNVSYLFFEKGSGIDANETFTSSVFVKQGTSPGVAVVTWFLNSSGVQTVYARAYFDWASHQLTTDGTPHSFGSQDIGNGWFRIWTTATNSADTNSRVRIAIEPAGFFPGNQGTAYFWGAQLEKGFVPTSYIPTSGTEVERKADTLQLADLNWYGPGAGTFQIQLRRSVFETPPIVDPVVPNVFALTDNAGGEISLSYDPNKGMRAHYAASGNGVEWGVSSMLNPSDLMKVVLGLSSSDAFLAVAGQGAHAPSIVSGPFIPTKLSFSGVDTGSGWNGFFTRLVYWPQLVSEQESLTLSK